METPLLIADASTLLNFLFVRRFDLVQALGYRVRIVDAVYEEIQSTRKELDELIEQDEIRTMTLEGDAYLNRLASALSIAVLTPAKRSVWRPQSSAAELSQWTTVGP